MIALFVWIVVRAFAIGRQARLRERHFAALAAQGIGIWIGFQALINMGVNMGLLPTKGLTLPLMSYGGSGLLVNFVALAILLRIDWENRQLAQRAARMNTHPHHGRRHRRAHLSRARGRRADARRRLGRGLDGRARRHGRAPGADARLPHGVDPRAAPRAARGCVQKLLLPANLLLSFWESARHIRRIRPDVVLGLGGYVAFPGGMMASLLGRPLALHEQNAIAGLANRVLAGVSDKVMAGLPAAR